jgi:hypothetical protein
MSISRPIQWYHSHADPIWPDGTFKTPIVLDCVLYCIFSITYSLPACPQPPVLWARDPVTSWLPAGPRHKRESELENHALNSWPATCLKHRMSINKRTTTMQRRQ